MLPPRPASAGAARAARLSALKHATDLDTPAFSHRIIAAYLESGRFPAHLATLRAEYRRRRDAMLAALALHFPGDVIWNHPTSGMFVWVELPPGLDATELLRVAVANRLIGRDRVELRVGMPCGRRKMMVRPADMLARRRGDR